MGDFETLTPPTLLLGTGLSDSCRMPRLLHLRANLSLDHRGCVSEYLIDSASGEGILPAERPVHEDLTRLT